MLLQGATQGPHSRAPRAPTLHRARDEEERYSRKGDEEPVGHFQDEPAVARDDNWFSHTNCGEGLTSVERFNATVVAR